MKQFAQTRPFYFSAAALFLFIIYLLVENITLFEYRFSVSDFLTDSFAVPTPTQSLPPPETSSMPESAPAEGVAVQIPSSTSILATESGELSAFSSSGSSSSNASSFQVEHPTTSVIQGFMEIAKSSGVASPPPTTQKIETNANRITGERKVNVGNKSIPFPKGGRALYGDMYLRNPGLLSSGVSQVINQIVSGVEIRFSFLKMIRDPSFNRLFIESAGTDKSLDKGYEMDHGYRYEVSGPILEAAARYHKEGAPCLLFGQAALQLMSEQKIDLIVHIGKFGMVREGGPLGDYDGNAASSLFETARNKKIPIFIFLTDGKGMQNESEIVSDENPWSPPKHFVDSIRSTKGDVIDITGRSWHRKLDLLIKNAPSDGDRLKIERQYWFYLADEEQHRWWIERGF